jgi:hypothetical protein
MGTHVAFVLDNGTGYMYVNGVQMGTGSLSTVNTPSNGGNVIVGERVSGGSIPFQGGLDEIRIWNVARTATEIQANMNVEFCSPNPNLKLYLKLNEGTAGANNAGITSAADNSGNGNNGILNNFSLIGTTSNWISGSGISSANSTSSVQQTACDQFSLTANSTVYTTSGTYIEVITNTSGCNETVTLDLTINNNTSSTDVQTACGSYTWINGDNYTSNNNTAIYVLSNAAGCDSIITLDLTISNNTSSTDIQTACDSYTWINGNTYTSNNNTATYTLSNAAGCDSIVTLNLTINTVNTSATQNEVVLTANEAGATYQWVECPSMTSINGATSQSYTATTNGDYAVIVTNTQCSDTSTCYAVTTVGTIENEFGRNLQLFPNPTNGAFSIDMGEKYKETTITIMDLTGKLILSNTYNNHQLLNVNLEEPSGIYVLVIEAENKKAVIQLVKK